MEGDETLWITSSRQLTKNLAGQPLPADNLVVMKAAARLRETIAWLEQRNLLPGCHAVRRCSHADETVFMDPKELLAEKPDYWTLLLCFARRS